ncbi:MAG: glutamine synthetase [Candidatus Heimdallarchaeota archaeon]|nr:glutamine synthetase [Candidatus Heimdallarchaeota archaeon]
MYNILEIRFVDINGSLKAMNVPVEIEEITNASNDPIFTEGANIDGSSVAGFTPLEDSDLHLIPDLSSLTEISYTEEPKLATMCTIYQRGKIFPGDTRSRLKYIIKEKLESRNWTLKVGPEPEFVLLKDSKPIDEGDYADIYPRAIAEGMVKRFPQHLSKAKIKTKVHHHEVGPGQYEIEIGHNEVLLQADAILTYKATIRALAVKMGYLASFMPKPFGNQPGNGMHFHISLWEDEKNLFATKNVNEISKLGQHFMAGILEHSQAITALVAPTINSYKRLVPGFEAPVYIAWGPLNRSALIRVPMYQIPSLARFEYRCPDPSTNPYIAFLALISAGLDGIDRELELVSPVTQNIFTLSSEERDRLNIKTLPGNLFEALSFLKSNRLLRQALGEHIYSQFLKIKQEEWLQYSTQVTDWDWKKYLHI